MGIEYLTQRKLQNEAERIQQDQPVGFYEPLLDECPKWATLCGVGVLLEASGGN